MIQPTAVYQPFDGKIEIRLYGRPHNWSLKIPKGEETPPADTLECIKSVMDEAGIQKLYAPRPTTFNAKVCQISHLNPTYDIGGGAKIWRGTDADGVVLTSTKDAFFTASADCISIVAMGTTVQDKIVVIPAHGGRDCLVDRGRINGEKAREHESVVHAIMARFKELGIKPANVKIFMTCGVSPYEFDHPYDHEIYGHANTRMVSDVVHKWGLNCVQGDMTRGKLILSEIIRSQFIKLGVQSFNIGSDVTDTYGAMDQAGNHIWHSYRRSTRLGDGQGHMRNGVFVILKRDNKLLCEGCCNCSIEAKGRCMAMQTCICHQLCDGTGNFTLDQ